MHGKCIFEETLVSVPGWARVNVQLLRHQAFELMNQIIRVIHYTQITVTVSWQQMIPEDVVLKSE